LRLRGPIVLYQPQDESSVMPLGLLHLASALGPPVTIVDGRLDLAPEARVAGLAREALCLGVSVRTGKPIADALRICRASRAVNPDLPIVWGGPHPSLFPEQCLGSGVADACVRGPGEETLVELASAFRAERPGAGLPGVAFRRGEEVVVGPPREWREPARSPRADYGFLDVEHYFRLRGSRRLDYCSSRRPWPASAGEWSGLSARRVVDELGELVARWRLSEVAFQDEDFFADPRRVEAIARGLLEAGIQVEWSAAGPAATLARLSGEHLRALAASGCRRVVVRTPGDTVLRGEAGDAVREAGRRLHTAGIAGRFAFVAGFPGRGKGGLAEIHRLALQLRRLDARFETPIRLHAPIPGAPGDAPPGFVAPRGLEEWAEVDLAGASLPDALRRRAARCDFFLGEAFRAPGGRLGKRLVRLIARARVFFRFYALDFDRRVVEWSARVRTGRTRAGGAVD
jgi:B12 binding protein